MITSAAPTVYTPDGITTSGPLLEKDVRVNENIKENEIQSVKLLKKITFSPTY